MKIWENAFLFFMQKIKSKLVKNSIAVFYLMKLVMKDGLLVQWLEFAVKILLDSENMQILIILNIALYHNNQNLHSKKIFNNNNDNIIY